MGLKIKNFNIMKVHWKIRFLGGGFTKNQYIAGIAWKKGLGQFAKLKRGAWQKRGGWLIPQCTLFHILIYCLSNFPAVAHKVANPRRGKFTCNGVILNDFFNKVANPWQGKTSSFISKYTTLNWCFSSTVLL